LAGPPAAVGPSSPVPRLGMDPASALPAISGEGRGPKMTVDSARRVFEVSGSDAGTGSDAETGSDAGGRRSESEDSCSEGWSTWIRSEPHRRTQHSRTQHSRTQHSRTPHLSAPPRSLHDRWAAVSPSRILPGRHRLWSLSRLGCLRAGAHRPSARRLALFGLALLLGGIDGEACRAAACPHQRRADLPTTSPPTQSGETIECPAGVFSSIRGTGVGGGCPPDDLSALGDHGSHLPPKGACSRNARRG